MEPLALDPEIQADYVTLFEFSRARYSMDNFVIDRGAENRRVRRHPPGGIIQKGRIQSPPLQFFPSKLVEFAGGYPGLGLLLQVQQNLTGMLTDFTHLVQFPAALQANFLPVAHAASNAATMA